MHLSYPLPLATRTGRRFGEMLRLLIFLSYLFGGVVVQAQVNSIWQLGNGPGGVVGEPNVGHVLMDFREDTISMERTYFQAPNWAVSGVCYTGEHLAFSNGCYALFDTTQLIDIKQYVAFEYPDSESCDRTYGATLAETLMLPFGPDSLISFSPALEYVRSSGWIYPAGFTQMNYVSDTSGFWSVNSSVPNVYFGHQPRENSNSTFAAVYDSINHSYWMATRAQDREEHTVSRVTYDTIELVSRIDYGETFHTVGDGISASVFAQDGSRYASYEQDNGCWLFDFDMQSGELSNGQLLPGSLTEDISLIINRSGDVAFSHDGSKLYLSLTYYLIQYDLAVQPITADTIAHFLVGDNSTRNTSFQSMALGLDGRIYVAGAGIHNSYSVIDQPWRAGDSCYVYVHQLELPFYFNGGWLPYFASFPGWPVDTTKVLVLPPWEDPFRFDGRTSSTAAAPGAVDVQLWPNPAHDDLHWQSDEPIEMMAFFSVDGRELFRRPAGRTTSGTLDLSHLPPGMYFLHLLSPRGRTVRQVVVGDQSY